MDTYTYIVAVWKEGKQGAKSMCLFQTQTPGDKICVFTSQTLKKVCDAIKNSEILNKYKWKLCLVDITHNPNGDNGGKDV